MREHYHERLDTPRRDPTPADVTYVVCTMMRSGSNLLCEGLRGTGLAGVPVEYFHPRHRPELTERWGCGAAAHDLLREARAHRTGPNGVFGLKLHAHQLRNLDALDVLLPGATLVHLRRRDVDAQAVSLWTGFHTRQFSRAPGAPEASVGPAPYSYAGILRARRAIVAGAREWEGFFARRAEAPVEVVYEELAADYEREVHRVLTAIVPGAPADAIRPPGVVRQSGEHSRQLTARFTEERTRRGDRDVGPRQVARRVRRRLARARASTHVVG